MMVVSPVISDRHETPVAIERGDDGDDDDGAIHKSLGSRRRSSTFTTTTFSSIRHPWNVSRTYAIYELDN